MKNKKFISVVLVAAMSAALLAGCGSGSGDNGNGGNGGNSGNNAGGKQTIRLFRDCFNLGTPDSAEVKKVENAINK